MCIYTRNFWTFLSNSSGYTYPIWETPPVCLNLLQSFSSEANDTYITFQCFLWISTLHPECTKDLLGTVPSTVLCTKAEVASVVQYPGGPSGLLWSPEETFTCRKLESRNSGTWKSSQGLQNWNSPGNKRTAKTSQRLLLIVCVLEFKDLELKLM